MMFHVKKLLLIDVYDVFDKKKWQTIGFYKAGIVFRVMHL